MPIDSKEGVKAFSSMISKQNELKERLETMYSDRLTGVLSVDDYVRMSDKVKKEMYCIEEKISSIENTKGENLEDKVRLLELAQKAASLYSKQDSYEKRKLLNLVYSNSSWKDGQLTPNFRKPFDIIAELNVDQEKKWPLLLRKVTILIFGVPYRI